MANGQQNEEQRWAKPTERLGVDPADMKHGYNVEGRKVLGPHQGFGSLWDRTFTAELGDVVTPEALIAHWRANFGSFWPKGGTFRGSMASINAGDVAPLSAGGVATGILVIYADDTSFSFMTPEGHPFAGMITFTGRTAAGSEPPGTVAEIRMLVRPADPMWQLVWPVAKVKEGQFWRGTLRNLAAAYGLPTVKPVEASTCVDRRWQWKNWRNIHTNGLAATAWHAATTPFRRKQA